ncbi:MAG: ABC transporter permease [Thermoleophilaceae bacterium]|nr:ABC transporter permease [Thermoleophilaceae bacterium]
MRAALGNEATAAQIDAFKKRYGLDRPLPARYATWFSDYVRGDWGLSPITERPVRAEALPRLGRTILLMLIAVAVALPVALLTGVVCAVRAGGRLDRSVNVLIVVLAALPEFVVGIALVTVFAVWLGDLPVDSSGLLFGGPVDRVKAYVLPAATLALAVAPQIVRLTRAAVGEVIPAPYVRAATLRGLSRRTVVSSYLLPNAAGPLANVVATNMVYLLGGAIVVEQVFSFPGVGRRLIEAIGQGDTVTVQALALALGVLTLLISYATDAVVRMANPRLRAGR